MKLSFRVQCIGNYTAVDILKIIKKENVSREENEMNKRGGAGAIFSPFNSNNRDCVPFERLFNPFTAATLAESNRKRNNITLYVCL